MGDDHSLNDDIDKHDPLYQFLAGPPPRRVTDERAVTAALEQLDAAARLATSPDAGRLWMPGLAIVVIGGRHDGFPQPHCQGYGVADLATGTPVTPQTLFACASLSKPVSVTLIVNARGKDQIAWKSPVLQADGTEYHLAKASDRKQALWEWVSHRSGMPDHAGDLIEDMNPAMPRDQILARIMANQTGLVEDRFEYTNFGFTMGCLGAIKDQIVPVDWERFAERQLRRLGMNRSTYTFTPAIGGDTRVRAVPHQGKPHASELLSLEPIGWRWHAASVERNPTRQAPAGGLASCAEDLGYFLRAHLIEAFGDYPPRNPPAEELKGRPYSRGWNVVQGGGTPLSFSHSGAFSLGAATYLRFDPGVGYGIAVLSNGEPTGVPEALGQLFFKYLYGQALPAGRDHAALFALARRLMMGDMYEKKIKNTRRYDGKTQRFHASIPRGEIFRGHSPYYGCDLAIERRDDPAAGKDPELYVNMGRDAQGQVTWQLPLRCYEAASSTFVYDTTGENEVGPSAIHLTWEGGVLVKVEDDWLESSGLGLGVFTRQS